MSAPVRTATKIMIVRHGEKPGKDGQKPYGVDEDGQQDDLSLSPTGWQRAGALAVLFDPARGPLQHPALAVPQHLFAGDPSRSGKGISKRPLETITPLSRRLGLTINQTYAVGQEQQVANAAMAHSGVVLIGWEHKHIPLIANQILGDTTTVPQSWPSERFDVVLVFDLQDGAYRFSQVPELLLYGDSADPIR